MSFAFLLSRCTDPAMVGGLQGAALVEAAAKLNSLVIFHPVYYHFSLIDFSFIRKEVIDTLLLVDSHAKTLKEKSMHGKASAALRKG